MIRIGVDAREILGNTTGVGVYLGELLRRWTARSDAAARQFVLFAPEPLPQTFPPNSVETCIVGRDAGSGTWWEQTALRRAAGREGLNVFFAPAYTAPLGIRAPLALTIHDVSFLAHPEWFRPRERWRRRFVTGRAAAAASVILTDSEFSRSEIRRHLRVDADRIRVIPPGFTLRATATLPDGAREPLVLFVGSLFNRRRLPQLIAAFARATGDIPRARLVVVGADRTWPREDLAAVAAMHGVSDRVECRRYVSDAELASLYGRASVFAFLSDYEGFGMTPLEALAVGVPIVVLDTQISREIYGPAAAYVPPHDDGTAAAATIRSLLMVPSAGAGTLQHAPGVLRLYSWDRAADDTLKEIERIVV